MRILQILLALLVLSSSVISIAEEKQDDGYVHHKINFLPDGTQLKFENDKVFYVCNKKLKPMPSGRYMLADGTVIKVKLSKVVSDRHKYQRPNKEKSQKRADKAKKKNKKEKLMPHIKEKKN